MQDTKVSVAILGCGFMGTALLSGILASTPRADSRVKQYFAAVQRQQSAQRLLDLFADQNDYVRVLCNDNRQALSSADVVVLGVQPADVQSVLGIPEISDLLSGKLVISMVAGYSCQKLKEIIQTASDQSQPHLVRVIPSIGAQINESASLVSQSELSKSESDFVKWLFDRVGKSEIVQEDLLDAAVAVSATTHALVVTAIDSIVDGSVSRGIPRATALKIAAQCMRGASSLLIGHMNLEELKDSMSVPKGITTEAWVHLDSENTRRAISQTVRHAIDYAQSMS